MATPYTRHRVLVLPDPLAANAIYYVAVGADKFEMHITNAAGELISMAGGTAVLDEATIAELMDKDDTVLATESPMPMMYYRAGAPLTKGYPVGLADDGRIYPLADDIDQIAKPDPATIVSGSHSNSNTQVSNTIPGDDPDTNITLSATGTPGQLQLMTPSTGDPTRNIALSGTAVFTLNQNTPVNGNHAALATVSTADNKIVNVHSITPGAPGTGYTLTAPFSVDAPVSVNHVGLVDIGKETSTGNTIYLVVMVRSDNVVSFKCESLDSGYTIVGTTTEFTQANIVQTRFIAIDDSAVFAYTVDNGDDSYTTYYRPISFGINTTDCFVDIGPAVTSGVLESRHGGYEQQLGLSLTDDLNTDVAGNNAALIYAAMPVDSKRPTLTVLEPVNGQNQLTVTVYYDQEPLPFTNASVAACITSQRGMLGIIDTDNGAAYFKPLVNNGTTGIEFGELTEGFPSDSFSATGAYISQVVITGFGFYMLTRRLTGASGPYITYRADPDSGVITHVTDANLLYIGFASEDATALSMSPIYSFGSIYKEYVHAGNPAVIGKPYFYNDYGSVGTVVPGGLLIHPTMPGYRNVPTYLQYLEDNAAQEALLPNQGSEVPPVLGDIIFLTDDGLETGTVIKTIYYAGSYYKWLPLTGESSPSDAVVVKVQAGEVITKGDCLYISGYDATNECPIVSIVDISQGDDAAGIASTDFAAIGDLGSMVTSGMVRGLDTTGYLMGSSLYAAETGGLSTTGSVNHANQIVATTTRVGLTDGEVLVDIVSKNTSRVSAEYIHAVLNTDRVSKTAGYLVEWDGIGTSNGIPRVGLTGFQLRAGVSYAIHVQLNVVWTTEANGNATFILCDQNGDVLNDTGVINIRAGDSQSWSSGNSSLDVIYTPAIDTVVQVKCTSTHPSTFKVGKFTSTFSIQAIANQLPVTNPLAHQHIHCVLSANTVLVNNTPVGPFSTESSDGLVLSNNSVLLKANVTYKCTACLTMISASNANTYSVYKWHNDESDTWFGNKGFNYPLTHAATRSDQSTAVGYITPLVDTSVSLRQFTANGVSSADAEYSYFTIEAVTGQLPVTTIGSYEGTQKIGVTHSANIAISNTNIVTGHDLTIPGTKLEFGFADTNGMPWSKATIDRDELMSYGSAYCWNFDNAYVQVTVVDAATGTLFFNDLARDSLYKSSTLYIDAANGYVVPVGTVAATPRGISVVSPLALVNGLASDTALEAVGVSMQLDLTPGYAIDTVSISNGTINVLNALTGMVYVVAGNASAVITMTERAAQTYVGLQRVGAEHRPATATVLDNTLISTGHDLTIPGSTLRIVMQEEANGVGIGIGELVCADLVAKGLGYIYTFDNGHIKVTVEDAATGQIRLVDTGLNTSYVASSLWVEAANGYVVPTATDNIKAHTDVNVLPHAMQTTIAQGATLRCFDGVNFEADTVEGFRDDGTTEYFASPWGIEVWLQRGDRQFQFRNRTGTSKVGYAEYSYARINDNATGRGIRAISMSNNATNFMWADSSLNLTDYGDLEKMTLTWADSDLAMAAGDFQVFEITCIVGAGYLQNYHSVKRLR